MASTKLRFVVVRFSDNTFGVGTSGSGAMKYLTAAGTLTENVKLAWTGTASEATVRHSMAAGTTPTRITAGSFRTLTAHVPMREGTRKALRALMVEGKTWKEAAAIGGITESGIKRVLDRVRKANPGVDLTA